MNPGDLVSVTHKGDVINPNPEGFWGRSDAGGVFVECGSHGIILNVIGRVLLVAFSDRVCWMDEGALERAA